MLEEGALSAAAGIVLSLLVSYFPGFNDWFDKRDPVTKRLLMGVFIIVVGVGSAVASCQAQAECLGGLDFGAYLSAILAALIANQSMYLLSPASSKKA